MSRAVARVYTRTDTERETTPASLQLVSPSFFPVLGVAPVLGRTLPLDPEGALAYEPVVVLSHAYWQRRFGGSPDVVGSRLAINGTAFTIVGVGPRDFAGVWLEAPVDIWVPLTMQPAVKYSQSFVMAALVLLTSGFGALALGLAGFGLFGVLSYAVARRTPEFGLRMALGASRSQILRSVVRDALWLVAGGVLVGLPCVFIAGSVVSALFFGVSPYDGAAVGAAAFVLLAVGAACGVIPALRAARVDPIVALRQE
jgi:hypothetical protein